MCIDLITSVIVGFMGGISFLPEGFSRYGLVRDVFALLAGVRTLCIASEGLKTRKKQKKRESNYVLAKNILVGVYKFRDAIDGVRNPFMWAGEGGEVPKDTPKEEHNYRESSLAYQSRFDAVSAARTLIQENLLEAEVIMNDKELLDRCKLLRKIQGELMSHVRRHLDSLKPHPRIKRSADDNILYAGFEDPDNFSIRLQEVVIFIEKILAPYLRK